MPFLSYSHFLWIFVLVAFAVTSNADVTPQYNEEFAARALVAPGITNVTNLNNRFADLSLDYISIRSEGFTIDQVALGFINAVKREAIKDCDQYIASYTFTDTEYADDPIRIQINAAAGGPEGQLVRCNLVYAIKTLAIDLMTQEILYGARFTESYRGQLLYVGVFDNKNDVPSLEQSSNSWADPSETLAQERRALSTQSLNATNSSTTLLAMTGSNDVEYRIEFDFRKNRVPKTAIFSAILEFMMTLAQLDNDDQIENVSQATSTDSSWIFVMHNSESSVSLEGFQLVAILEGIARHAVHWGRYVEMTFDFFVNREFVAGGCVTVPNRSRAWCQGLREGGPQSLVKNSSSSSGSDLIQT
ncbi:hypothetical protein HO133_008601 [Letharia lupina]|uniref:Uncharacterized protein n=2 Tax=Letharia TaxID=112415 RepID=A0A8H6CP68_9LECA|nr:uncharacterized protein HO133_008601 [Letharia lupina]KAF6227159.1 hypothetical protein HO133_008601 [Letharia lupina]